MDIYVVWSFYLGLICAGSLMVGAVIGVKFNLPKHIVGLMAAFGAGALLSALALELVAPTVDAMLRATDPEKKSEEVFHFFSMIGGALAGGLIFVLLDQVLIEHGGYLRKTAYILAHQHTQKRTAHENLLVSLSQSPVFVRLTPQEVSEIVRHLKPAYFNEGEQIFNAGDPSNELLFIQNGTASLSITSTQTVERTRGDVIGEIPLLSGGNHISDCVATTAVEALRMSRHDADQLLQSMPSFRESLQTQAAQHLEARKKVVAQSDESRQAWIDASIDAAEHGRQLPTAAELATSHASHGNAAVAIWLGNLLDGIPESFVLGTLLTTTVAAKLAASGAVDFTDVLPYTLIAGLFLSNLPEALSSSAQMKAQGMSTAKIYFMWGSLVLLTGIGAALGAVLGEHIPHSAMIFAEGIAAGAMLTMICAAMLPEATHLASANLAGIFTLGGFLSALLFKVLEL